MAPAMQFYLTAPDSFGQSLAWRPEPAARANPYVRVYRQVASGASTLHSAPASQYHSFLLGPLEIILAPPPFLLSGAFRFHSIAINPAVGPGREEYGPPGIRRSPEGHAQGRPVFRDAVAYGSCQWPLGARDVPL
jgi:hypothetical protein